MASATREEIQQEALSRAMNGQTLTNWPAIFAGFMEKGIPESEIRPRENVLTYHAWRALGRQVRRGEHGVKVVTFVECAGKAEDAEQASDASQPARKKRGYRGPWTATVFHVSQTDPIAK
jgi:antirestriction protein ArdC